MNKGKKMAKKKILHIVESFGSGVFSFLVDLVNNTDKDFDITIAYGVREETLVNFKEYFSDRVKFIKVENFVRSINIKKDFKRRSVGIADDIWNRLQSFYKNNPSRDSRYVLDALLDEALKKYEE